MFDFNGPPAASVGTGHMIVYCITIQHVSLYHSQPVPNKRLKTTSTNFLSQGRW